MPNTLPLPVQRLAARDSLSLSHRIGLYKLTYLFQPITVQNKFLAPFSYRKWLFLKPNTAAVQA